MPASSAQRPDYLTTGQLAPRSGRRLAAPATRRGATHLVLVATSLAALPLSACSRQPAPAAVRPTLLVAKLVDRQEARPGEQLAYTLVVMNDDLSGEDPGIQVELRDELPDEVELVVGSLSANAAYDAATRTVSWTGSVPQGLSVEVSFRAQLTPAAADLRSVFNTLQVRDAFGREVVGSAQTQIVH